MPSRLIVIPLLATVAAGCGIVITKHEPMVYHRNREVRRYPKLEEPAKLGYPPCTDPSLVGTVTKGASNNHTTPRVKFGPRQEERIVRMAARHGGTHVVDIDEHSRRRETTVYSPTYVTTIENNGAIRTWAVLRCEND